MQKVFVVTDGEYSGYHIVGIFLDETKAKRCHELSLSQNDIEEYNLDEIKGDENIPDGYSRWMVLMFKDGNCNESPIKVNALCSYNKTEPKPYSDSTPDLYAFYVLAKDEQHAIRISNEQRVQLIAENRWCQTWTAWKILNKK